MPVLEPQAGEVLLKVRAITTCPHWDLHINDGEPMFPHMQLGYPYTPGQPGHEAYLDQLAKMHAVLVAAMKCKQTVDPAAVATLEAAIEAIAPMYVHEHSHDHDHSHGG